MISLLLAISCGLAFGTLAVLLMLPMPFADKKSALLGAFASRFAIGFLIPFVSLPVPGTVAGGIVGLLISLPDAIITKAYVPILGVGLLGGALIGWLVAHA